MKYFRIVSIDQTGGIGVVVVQANCVADALINTGDMYNLDVIKVELCDADGATV